MREIYRLLELLPELTASGLLDASGGNIALRTDRGVYVTRSQAGEQLRWHLEPDDFILFPGGGEASMAKAGRRPSRDNRVHRELMQAMPEWKLTIHCHSWGLVGFALAAQSLPVPAGFAELIERGHPCKIPCASISPDAPPPAVASQLAGLMADNFSGKPHGAVLLAGHGPYIGGVGIESTLSFAQALENIARAQHWRLRD